MKGIMHRAMRHWSPTTGINGEFKNGGKMHLIAQLLDGAMRSLRSMNTAQPWVVEGRTSECFWNFSCRQRMCWMYT